VKKREALGARGALEHPSLPNGQENVMNSAGKVVVITGATSGLGQAFAVEAARGGARVFLVGRDAQRASETLAMIQQMKGKAEVALGDVSTLAGARAVAAQILAKTPRVDVLVNNAGGMFKQASKTEDGIDTTFAVNTVGAFVLEKELHGALSAAKGRVVNVVTGLLNSFPVDVDDLVSPKSFKGLAQYGRSKQASVMMTVEQAKRFSADGVSVVSIHPGVILGTRFGGGQPKLMQVLAGPLMRAVGFACTVPEAARRFMVASFGDVPSGELPGEGKAGQPAEAGQRRRDPRTRLHAARGDRREGSPADDRSRELSGVNRSRACRR
jgi:retinol dehydrogenase 14